MLNGFSGPNGCLVTAARDAENYREAKVAVGTRERKAASGKRPDVCTHHKHIHM